MSGAMPISNSALGTFPRLLDIGIAPDIMAGNIIGIIAQRLVRLLCKHCKEAYTPSPEERQLLGGNLDSGAKVFRPVGCDRCNHRGYRGRTAILEILHMDSDLDELVARRATPRELREAANAKNFRSLAEEGVQRVAEGATSLAEVARAIDLTGRVH